MIRKDVVICDWHYERALPTAAYFATKGFRVIECPWRKPDVAVEQLQTMLEMRDNSTDKMKDKYLGVMQTTWSSFEGFMDEYKNGVAEGRRDSGVQSFNALVKEWSK
jgi:hypothetical protein